MFHMPSGRHSNMNRRQLLAGFAPSLALGSGCLRIFGNGEDSQDAEPGERSQTATPTQPSPESTSPATTTDSSPGTPAGSSSQSTLIDTTNRTTYTSNRAPYSIKYPASWKVTVAGQGTVRFTDPVSPARMLVRVKDSVPSIISRGMIVTTAVQRAKRQYSLDQVTRLNQRNTTLSNGTPATVVELRMSRSADNTVLRGTVLVAHVSNTVYAAGIFVPKHAFTPAVERAMTTLVGSLTIHDTTSARHR